MLLNLLSALSSVIMYDLLACFAKQNRRLADVSLAIIPVPFYRQPIMQDHLACFAQAKQEAGGRALKAKAARIPACPAP